MYVADSEASSALSLVRTSFTRLIDVVAEAIPHQSQHLTISESVIATRLARFRWAGAH